MEACRDLCLTAPYRCHSFDYGDTGERVCRLSHHTSTTLTQIQVSLKNGPKWHNSKKSKMSRLFNLEPLQ
jgi:hypothetical protein